MNNQIRVLVVDDVRDTRQLLCEAIASIGRHYAVAGVPSGEEAQLELARTLPHLLVTDVRLAGITGLELLKKVRARNTELKVIVITGLGERDIRRQALESGANAFFTQPVDLKAFLDEVRRLVSGIKLDEVLKKSPPAPEEFDKINPENQIKTKLEESLSTLNAGAVFLLDEGGNPRYSMMSGPETAIDGNLYRVLMQSCRAGAALISSNEWDLQANWQIFFSDQRTYLLSPLELGFALLIIFSASEVKVLDQEYLEKFRLLIEELNNLLESSLGNDEISREVSAQELTGRTLNNSPVVEAEVEPDHKLEEIFSSSKQLEFSSANADQFWDDLSATTDQEYDQQGDMISYEQAKQMGLTPRGDEL